MLKSLDHQSEFLDCTLPDRPVDHLPGKQAAVPNRVASSWVAAIMVKEYNTRCTVSHHDPIRLWEAAFLRTK